MTINTKRVMGMKFFTVTEFKARATAIIREIEDTRKEVVITKRGKPVVLVRPISEDEFLLKPKPKERGKHGKAKRHV